MILTIKHNLFNINNTQFGPKSKNNIIESSDYYNIFYSDSLITLTNIYISIPILNIKLQYYFEKINIIFNKNENKNLLKNLVNIEKNILQKFASQFKNNQTPVFKIANNLNNELLKCVKKNRNHNYNLSQSKYETINVKISGIWKDAKNYGLIYKFLF